MTETAEAQEALPSVAHESWTDAYLLANKLFPVTNYGLDLFVADAVLQDPPQTMDQLSASRLPEQSVERMLHAKQALHASHKVTSGQFSFGSDAQGLQRMWKATAKSVQQLLIEGGCVFGNSFEVPPLMKEQLQLARAQVSPSGPLHGAQVDRLLLLRNQLAPTSVAIEEIDRIRDQYGRGEKPTMHTLIEHILDTTSEALRNHYGTVPHWYEVLAENTRTDSLLSTY